MEQWKLKFLKDVACLFALIISTGIIGFVFSGQIIFATLGVVVFCCAYAIQDTEDSKKTVN